MAKSRPRPSDPTGEKISVGPEERALFKRWREENGLNQKAFSKKVGASQGTISNLESGKHTQIKKSTYAKLILLCRRPDASPNTERMVQEIIGELVGVPESSLGVVRDLVRALKKTAPQPGGSNDTTSLDRDRSGSSKGTRSNE